MNYDIASDLAALCWINPFSEDRVELEARVTGTRFRAITPEARADHLSENIPLLQELCEQVIREQPTCPQYPEVVAFRLYHRLVPELDRVVVDAAAPRTVWRTFHAEWNTHFDPGDAAGSPFEPAVLFALFYQIRRAYHWIFRYVIGSGPEANKLRARVWESIFSADLKRYVAGFHREMNDVHTLITGPSGSGKSLVARAIGMSRYIPFDPVKEVFLTHPQEVFLSVNVAALPEQLLESELFGHAQGAFTGATRDRAGLFESTGPYGSLFLDEIGEADVSAQVKLLTVLQERRFTRLGETVGREAQGRVIAATNQELESAVAEGRFRQDLYFRLSADRLEMVPLQVLLQGRIDALRPMVEHISHRLLQESWSAEIVDDLLVFIEQRLGPEYAWPGNFRELEQCVRNFLIHRDYRPIRLVADPAAAIDQALGGLELSADQLLHRYAAALYQRLGSYRQVGQVLGVDQRTAKKYVEPAG